MADITCLLFSGNAFRKVSKSTRTLFKGSSLKVCYNCKWIAPSAKATSCSRCLMPLRRDSEDTIGNSNSFTSEKEIEENYTSSHDRKCSQKRLLRKLHTTRMRGCRKRKYTISRVCGHCHRIVNYEDILYQFCPDCGWPLVITNTTRSTYDRFSGAGPHNELQESEQNTISKHSEQEIIKKIWNVVDVCPNPGCQQLVRGSGVCPACGTAIVGVDYAFGDSSTATAQPDETHASDSSGTMLTLNTKPECHVRPSGVCAVFRSIKSWEPV
jgi:rRNA maturation endonuclease Nob1